MLQIIAKNSQIYTVHLPSHDKRIFRSTRIHYTGCLFRSTRIHYTMPHTGLPTKSVNFSCDCSIKAFIQFHFLTKMNITVVYNCYVQYYSTMYTKLIQ